jgi:hypothetical protein
MEPSKLFLIVVDTSTNQFANIGRGILNVQIIAAKDKTEAKQLFTKVYRPHILQQIQFCTYVYDLEEISTNLRAIDATKVIPLFSHLPLQGGRPPKPEPLIPDKTVDQIAAMPQTQPQAQAQPQIAGVPQPPVQQRSVQQPRPQQGKFTQDQINLIKTFGALPTPQGENSHFNPRLNASVGVDGNVPQNMIQKPVDVDRLTPDQLQMLQAAGVNLNELRMNIEVNRDEIPPVIEQQYAELGALTEEKPLSNEELAKLKEQI